MKVMHVPYTFHPDPVGGTEIYVEALARSLSRLGVESVICAPGGRDDAYARNGLQIFRFGSQAPPLALEYCYDEGDPGAAEAFGRILARERPDLVHLHALSPAVSLRLIRRATPSD